MEYQQARKYRLIVGNGLTGDGLLVEDLQLTFDISKSTNNKDRTNSAAIEIYNLSTESLKKIDVDYPVAQLEVGYVDLGLKQIFSGRVSLVTTRKSGTDRVTQLQLGTAYTELNHQVLNELVAPGRTLQDVVEDIRKNLPGVSRGVYNGTNFNNPIIYGYPLMGTPKEMLNQISEKYAMHWQIEDDVLYVHSNDRANNEDFDGAYVISKDSGLIENAYRVTVQERRSTKDKAKKQGVQWKMLLNPNITAGSIVKLEDSLLSGWYRVDNLRHSGDYRGQNWYTEVQCSAIEKVVRT